MIPAVTKMMGRCLVFGLARINSATLEPAHAGHLHIQQHQREIVLQGEPESFIPGRGLYQINPRVVQHGIKRKQNSRDDHRPAEPQHFQTLSAPIP